MPHNHRLELALSPSPLAPATARDALDELAPVVEPELLESLRLLVSELVTNSVRHADLSRQNRIALRVEAQQRRVRVGVTDPGPGFQRTTPSPRRVDPSGWGLYLVSKVADRWGVERGDGTTVWFEIDRTRSDGPVAADPGRASGL